jgi:alpha-methylacyl-CoA racemase
VFVFLNLRAWLQVWLLGLLTKFRVILTIMFIGPFAGLLLADWGASVLRIDRSVDAVNPGPTADVLNRRKSSIAVNLKSPAAIALIKDLVKHVDVVIDPFRPGVLERLGLSPEDVLLPLNERLIIGRMTGFRREGKYAQMAGHDINYIAVSGVLSLLGRKGEKPLSPGNLLGDFAGGGAMCFLGIVLALFGRMSTGKGQVVEANMVDGASFLATMPRLSQKREIWNRERGDNLLDSGCPYYDTYETRDGKYIAV